MSRPTAIRDAVATALQGETFSRGIVVGTAHTPVINREQASQLEVTVVAGPTRREWSTRTGIKQQTAIDVVIDQAVGATEGNAARTEIDALDTLAEEIADFCTALRLASLGATCIAVESGEPDENLYSTEELTRLHLFKTAYRLTFIHFHEVR